MYKRCMYACAQHHTQRKTFTVQGRSHIGSSEREARAHGVHEKRRGDHACPHCAAVFGGASGLTRPRAHGAQTDKVSSSVIFYSRTYLSTPHGKQQGTQKETLLTRHVFILSLAIVELVAHQPAHRRVRANEAHHFARYGDSGCATAGHACVLHASSCRNVYSERSAALAEHTTCTCSPVRTPPPQLTEHADHSPAETPGTHSCSFVSSSAGQSAPPCAGAISRVRCRRSMLPPPAKASQPLHALTAQSIAARKRGGQDRRVRRRSRVSR